MSRDPFGLVRRDAPAAPTPSRESGWSKVIVGMLVGVALLLAYQNYSPDNGHAPVDPPTPNAMGKTLVFIHERKEQSIEHDLLLREMPEFCKSHNLAGGFRALDDDLQDEPVPQLIAYAKSLGVHPPLVILTDANDKPIKAAAWPDLAGLEKLIQ